MNNLDYMKETRKDLLNRIKELLNDSVSNRGIEELDELRSEYVDIDARISILEEIIK